MIGRLVITRAAGGVRYGLQDDVTHRVVTLAEGDWLALPAHPYWGNEGFSGRAVDCGDGRLRVRVDDSGWCRCLDPFVGKVVIRESGTDAMPAAGEHEAPRTPPPTLALECELGHVRYLGVAQ